MISITDFKKIFPNCKTPGIWVPILSEELDKIQVDTRLRIAAFLAQCGYESAFFTVFEENFNYSKIGLLKIFPKYFPSDDMAALYARKPEKIANKVYASRMGNGNEASGDGWKYRGRGLIQLTGKNNYIAISDSIDKTLLEDPDKIKTDIKYCVITATWFWNKYNLNQLADKSDMIALTKKINGGIHGLSDRILLYNKILTVI